MTLLCCFWTILVIWAASCCFDHFRPLMCLERAKSSKKQPKMVKSGQNDQKKYKSSQKHPNTTKSICSLKRPKMDKIDPQKNGSPTWFWPSLSFFFGKKCRFFYPKIDPQVYYWTPPLAPGFWVGGRTQPVFAKENYPRVDNVPAREKFL